MRRLLFTLLLVLFLRGLSIAALCPEGDLDGDCKVNWEDVNEFAEEWLNSGCSDPSFCPDFDGVYGINFADFAVLANHWSQVGIALSINEFMASNSSESGISDPQGEYDDWVEIYNFGDTDIDVGGMYLTDDLNEPTKWQIPDSSPIQTTILAGDFIVIWADDDTEDGPLHADFKLSAGGEDIGLFLDAETMIDGIIFGEQVSDISYGRYPDATTNLRYMAFPTPGTDNNDGYLGLVEEVDISHLRGYYDTPFEVELKCDTNGFDGIRYTLDGSEPSVTTGTVYNPDVRIPITTTTCLRAIAYKAGYQPSSVNTHTYLFINDVAEQPTDPPGWPSDWGYDSEVSEIVPSDYEMDPRVVDNTLPGYSVHDALMVLPIVSIAMNPDDFISDASGLYANPGSTVEYKCSIEYMPLDGDDFQYDCKIENHGGSSRRPSRMQKHNLRLTFFAPYGPAKLEYPLFPEAPVEVFNKLLLRASFTDSWGLVSWREDAYRPNDSMYIRDVWMKESLGDMCQPSSYGNFVNLYVNGLYFGVFNLTELVADDFLAERFGGEPEDWEVDKDFGYYGAPLGPLWDVVANQINPSTQSGYEEIQNYIDVENFADYMLLHFYADPEDWPSHNGVAAVNPVSGDGKFRFFVWDQEIVLDKHGRAPSKIDDGSGVGDIFQNMRQSAEFRLLFADRVQKHYFNGGALSVTCSQDRYLEIANWIDKAIVAESARWGDTQMSTPYGSPIPIPSDPDNPDDTFYPMPPHGPDYYFTREDSWVPERDCVINNYIPDIHDTNNSYALINVLRDKNLFPDFDAPVFHVNDSYKHGGYVTDSDTITITDPDGAGTIYYTIDGNDPRLPGEASTPDSTVLVSENAAKTVLVPTGDIGTSWRGSNEPYDDSSWTSGTGGVGYDTGSEYDDWFDIDVEAELRGNYDTGSCYVRVPFTVDGGELPSYEGLVLKVSYDDGFVAYINGTEVKKVNEPTSLQWSSYSSTGHNSSGFESFDISTHLYTLQAGSNILAVHGLNNSGDSTDFLISVELEGLAGSIITEPNICPSAIEYTGGFNVDKSTDLKARIYKGSSEEWSALTEAVYGFGGIAESLRITEIMYHPQDTNDVNDPNEEYIELKNIGETTINLNLVSFTNGIDFTFGDRELSAGEYILVVKDQSAFEAQYGTGKPVAGDYIGSLANNGERIELEDAVGTKILNFHYSDNWRAITDGDGYSLTIVDATDADMNNWSEKDSWRASAYINGSPGWDDSGIVPNPSDIVINEVLAHSHAEAPDWIELYNATGADISIGGWYLSDSDSNLMKYEIEAGTVLGAGEYLVFYEDVNFGEASSDPGKLEPFALSENGEIVSLTSALDVNGVLTGYRQKEDFGASETGVSFGRYYKSSTNNFNFVSMDSNTPGTANAYPKVGPVVINEIMYSPASRGQNEEYIELYNISDTGVDLYEAEVPWKFTDGVDYTFPSNTTIPAYGYLLVVNTTPTYFKTKYSVPPGVEVLGPYEGRLSNGGEKVEISKPGEEYLGTRYYIRVERVAYSDGSHPEDCPGGVDLWPIEADGGGSSLTRIEPNLYGNDPNNWQAATPSPGS